MILISSFRKLSQNMVTSMSFPTIQRGISPFLLESWNQPHDGCEARLRPSRMRRFVPFDPASVASCPLCVFSGLIVLWHFTQICSQTNLVISTKFNLPRNFIRQDRSHYSLGSTFGRREITPCWHFAFFAVLMERGSTRRQSSDWRLFLWRTCCSDPIQSSSSRHRRSRLLQVSPLHKKTIQLAENIGFFSK